MTRTNHTDDGSEPPALRPGSNDDDQPGAGGAAVGIEDDGPALRLPGLGGAPLGVTA